MIHENRGSSFTLVEITDQIKEKVEQEVENYLKRYPYPGYMTRIIHDTHQEPNGKFAARISRFSSCD